MPGERPRPPSINVGQASPATAGSPSSSPLLPLLPPVNFPKSGNLPPFRASNSVHRQKSSHSKFDTCAITDRRGGEQGQMKNRTKPTQVSKARYVAQASGLSPSYPPSFSSFPSVKSSGICVHPRLSAVKRIRVNSRNSCKPSFPSVELPSIPIYSSEPAVHQVALSCPQSPPKNLFLQSRLSSTDYELRTTDYGLRTAACGLWTAAY